VDVEVNASGRLKVEGNESVCLSTELLCLGLISNLMQ
jgi:hypothetical protein